MKAKVLAFSRQESLFTRGDRVICAVSGGADSMAMLWCLHSLQQELGIMVSAAHFNHLLRCQASDADEEFVKDFCAAHGIPCYFGRGDVAAYAKEKTMGIEEAARELRYDFLQQLSCDKLATAHHADDNAETVLLHLLRGSGLRGLAGIRPKRGNLVRPLLTLTHEEILSYLRKQGIPWREDGSNEEDNCRRNRLRHRVLPLLKEEEEKVVSKLTAQSRLLRAEEDFLDRLAEELLRGAERVGGYDCAVLLAAEDVLQKRALRLMARSVLPKDVSQCHIEAMQKLLAADSPSGELALPGGFIVRRSYETISITQEMPGIFPATELKHPGETVIPELNMKISCVIAENFEKNANTPFHFAVKYDMITESILWARSRREKDRITMTNGHTKSLKKLFIERKIPRHLRQSLPVITQGEEILAVAGIGVSGRYAAAPGELALIIDIEKKET